MDLGLSGRRALVTGSSSGLGEAIARTLAAEGAAVVVHGRDERRTAAVAGAIGAAGYAVGDLTSDAGAERVAGAAGRVDILVNNAGRYESRTWSEAEPEQWVEAYETNVVSAVRLIRRLVPPMRERGWGRVVQIGGGLASQPTAAAPQYNATLAARHNLAVSLARELKGSGVTSNVVSPGAVLVDWMRPYVDTPEIQAIVHGNDVGRLGRPEEIAAAVAYLCGPAADYISGATLRVDGGTIISAF
ncbi:SDR family oxidoreductase [Dactylosporangium sp. AC04546]|uniref:SDR family NAD(P)-dependent oxidoreductase n=1 Tax=Dactylosporangium sp. AC04546 TaxID=2862460 RepID=UPI001EE11BD3|nr:SDR family oxidoreductase [Dactylosporangium sp. AC04546]WVK85620.1 SDR family oxidoreductase [Dactylosporangium sp. AC04546]